MKVTLKELRLERKIPIARILYVLGISRTTYWNIENKRASITPNQKSKISSLFMIKPEYVDW